MTYIKTIAGIFILIGLFDVFAFSRQDQRFQNIFDITNKSFEFEMLNAPPHYQTLEVTEDIAYQQLFRLILSFEKQADKQTNEGYSQRAEFLRSYLQRKAGLTFEQAKALKDYALNFSTQFGCLRESSNAERSKALLEYRNRIRRLLGESGFDILSQADPEFWTIYLYGSYQRQLFNDGDPADHNGDGNPNGCPDTSYGTADARGPNGEGACVHMEVGRPHEYPANYATRPVSRAWTAAHEIGHLFGGDHLDEGLMTPSCLRAANEYEFRPATIRRLRLTITNP